MLPGAVWFFSNTDLGKHKNHVIKVWLWLVNQKKHASRNGTLIKDNAFQPSHGKGNIDTSGTNKIHCRTFFFTASTFDLIVFFSGRVEKLVVYFGLYELPLYF